jgi:hypothetical protein
MQVILLRRSTNVFDLIAGLVQAFNMAPALGGDTLDVPQ